MQYIQFRANMAYSLSNVTLNSTFSINPRHSNDLINLACICAAILFHAIGSTLLLATYKGCKTPQHVFLTNLSLTELICNFLTATATILRGVSEEEYKPLATLLDGLLYTTFVYLHYATFFIITADRLAATLLHVHYKVKCTPGRGRLTVLAAWSVCVSTGVAVNVYNRYAHGSNWLYDFNEVYVYQIPMVLAWMYLFFALASYAIMFVCYTRSRRSATTHQFSTLQLFRKSKFYVSILLMTSFVMLVVVPFLLLAIARDHMSTTVESICELVTYLSDPLDFFIYVFIYDPVYLRLKRKIGGILTKFLSWSVASKSLSVEDYKTDLIG